MKMCFCRIGQAFAGQGRSTSGTKAPPRFAGRRIKLAYFTFRNAISFAVEQREDSDRRASMASTTLAMTPIHRLGLSCRDKADPSAEAATLELRCLITHDLILGSNAVIASGSIA